MYADIVSDGEPRPALHDQRRPSAALPEQLRNVLQPLVKLVGGKSNRDRIGAIVSDRTGSDQLWQMMRSGSSYVSRSELVLTFWDGLEAAAVGDRNRGQRRRRSDDHGGRVSGYNMEPSIFRSQRKSA